MKKLALVAALALASLSTPLFAQTVSGNFNVNVNLTAKCDLQTVGTPVLDFGSYTSLTTTTVTPTNIGLAFRCTRGFAAAPTVAFDTGTDKTSTASGATATGEGVVAGLRYTLAVSAGALVAGATATAGAPGSNGTADVYTYTISGSMPGLQAGQTPVGAQSQARVLTITY